MSTEHPTGSLIADKTIVDIHQPDPATQAAARRTVAGYATDADDLAMLLDALGLGET